jgi:hypothetical protein
MPFAMAVEASHIIGTNHCNMIGMKAVEALAYQVHQQHPTGG